MNDDDKKFEFEFDTGCDPWSPLMRMLSAMKDSRDAQLEELKNNPGKKFNDGKVFIDHTSIMLALGRAKRNDETGFIERPGDEQK